MRGTIISLILFVIVLIIFFGGLVTTQPGIMLSGFCALPFVMFSLGWTVRGLFNGRRLALVESAPQRIRGTKAQRPAPVSIEQTL